MQLQSLLSWSKTLSLRVKEARMHSLWLSFQNRMLCNLPLSQWTIYPSPVPATHSFWSHSHFQHINKWEKSFLYAFMTSHINDSAWCVNTYHLCFLHFKRTKVIFENMNEMFYEFRKKWFSCNENSIWKLRLHPLGTDRWCQPSLEWSLHF